MSANVGGPTSRDEFNEQFNEVEHGLEVAITNIPWYPDEEFDDDTRRELSTALAQLTEAKQRLIAVGKREAENGSHSGNGESTSDEKPGGSWWTKIKDDPRAPRIEAMAKMFGYHLADWRTRGDEPHDNWALFEYLGSDNVLAEGTLDEIEAWIREDAADHQLRLAEQSLYGIQGVCKLLDNSNDGQISHDDLVAAAQLIMREVKRVMDHIDNTRCNCDAEFLEKLRPAGSALDAYSPGMAMEHEIAREISKALHFVESNDLRELDGAAEAMPEIAAMAKALHTRLEQLCDGESAEEAA